MALLDSSFYLYVFVAQVLFYGSALMGFILPLQVDHRYHGSISCAFFALSAM